MSGKLAVRAFLFFNSRLHIFSPQSNGVHAESRGVFLGAPAV